MVGLQHSGITTIEQELCIEKETKMLRREENVLNTYTSVGQELSVMDPTHKPYQQLIKMIEDQTGYTIDECEEIEEYGKIIKKHLKKQSNIHLYTKLTEQLHQQKLIKENVKYTDFNTSLQRNKDGEIKNNGVREYLQQVNVTTKTSK